MLEQNIINRICDHVSYVAQYTGINQCYFQDMSCWVDAQSNASIKEPSAFTVGCAMDAIQHHPDRCTLGPHNRGLDHALHVIYAMYLCSLYRERPIPILEEQIYKHVAAADAYINEEKN